MNPIEMTYTSPVFEAMKNLLAFSESERGLPSKLYWALRCIVAEVVGAAAGDKLEVMMNYNKDKDSYTLDGRLSVNEALAVLQYVQANAYMAPIYELEAKRRVLFNNIESLKWKIFDEKMREGTKLPSKNWIKTLSYIVNSKEE